jgi:adenylate cyclase
VIFPLRFKLALLTSLLLVASVGLVSLLLLRQSSQALESEARKRGELLSEQLARNARDPYLLEDDLVLSQLVRSATEEDEIVVARIVDAQGELVASSREGDRDSVDRLTKSAALATRTAGDTLLVASRMTFRDVDLGEVQVVLDLDALIRPVVARARREVLVAASGLLTAGLLIAVLMSRRISRPLQRLREAAKALGAGDLSARVRPTSHDELGELTRAFNEMSESLSQKNRIETAFRRYVSDHVLREVLDSPESIRLQGETREVTVLFIDMRQFTRLTRSIGAERLVTFLNESFDLVTTHLLEHGATIDKYIGDAILAYIGAPIESSDHAERAVAAAIAVQRAVQERNAKREGTSPDFVRLDIGIGIHTGPVVLGNIGSELKMDYTAIGEPVNIANRLQALAGPGEIVISQQVRDRLADRVRVEPLGPQHIEGIDEELAAYRVLC